jgi:hypothetical protein
MRRSKRGGAAPPSLPGAQPQPPLQPPAHRGVLDRAERAAALLLGALPGGGGLGLGVLGGALGAGGEEYRDGGGFAPGSRRWRGRNGRPASRDGHSAGTRGLIFHQPALPALPRPPPPPPHLGATVGALCGAGGGVDGVLDLGVGGGELERLESRAEDGTGWQWGCGAGLGDRWAGREWERARLAAHTRRPPLPQGALVRPARRPAGAAPAMARGVPAWRRQCRPYDPGARAPSSVEARPPRAPPSQRAPCPAAPRGRAAPGSPAAWPARRRSQGRPSRWGRSTTRRRGRGRRRGTCLAGAPGGGGSGGRGGQSSR